MTDTVVAAPVVPVASSPVAKKSPAKKKTTVAAKKPVAVRPSTSLMATSAIKERKGSSLVSIKKYLAANYHVDPIKLAPFIRKFLAAAVISGTILQIKGHYKLAASVEIKPKKPIAKKVKPASASTPKKKKPVKKYKTASGEPAAKKAKKTPTKKSPRALKTQEENTSCC